MERTLEIALDQLLKHRLSSFHAINKLNNTDRIKEAEPGVPQWHDEGRRDCLQLSSVTRCSVLVCV